MPRINISLKTRGPGINKRRYDQITKNCDLPRNKTAAFGKSRIVRIKILSNRGKCRHQHFLGRAQNWAMRNYGFGIVSESVSVRILPDFLYLEDTQFGNYAAF